MTNWNQLRDRAYQTSMAHGFHKGNESAQHYLCLVITELAEAVEADRKGKRASVALYKRECQTPQAPEHVAKHKVFCFEQMIKDTLEDELADSTIRLLDLSGMLDLDLDAKIPQMINVCNSVHDGLGAEYTDSALTEHIYQVIRELTRVDPKDAIICALGEIITLAEFLEIDLAKHIELKMEYNETRSFRHGKFY